MKYHMKCGINAVCIFMCQLQVRQFSFSEICRQNCHFENGYHWITISLKKKGSHSKYFRASCQREKSVMNNVQSWNWVQFKIYLLDPDSVRRIHGPVKMAANHLPTGSHNFAWCGVNHHDRVTTLTLQNKYDPTLPSGYQKVAYPPEISFWIRNLFTHSKPLPGRFASTAKPPVHRVNAVYHEVITGSCESRDHQYDAPLTYRIMKSLLSQNNTFFIVKGSVVKDTADDPDCQRLGEQWYYLRFYVHRTMPPTEVRTTNCRLYINISQILLLYKTWGYYNKIKIYETLGGMLLIYKNAMVLVCTPWIRICYI